MGSYFSQAGNFADSADFPAAVEALIQLSPSASANFDGELTADWLKCHGNSYETGSTHVAVAQNDVFSPTVDRELRLLFSQFQWARFEVGNFKLNPTGIELPKFRNSLRTPLPRAEDESHE